MRECPNHGGAFDCTPFCNVCEGEQEYEAQSNVQVTALVVAILETKREGEAQCLTGYITQ